MMNIHKTISILILFVGLHLHSQEGTQTWRWQEPKADFEALLIGTDTISEATDPIGVNDHWWEAFGYPEMNQIINRAFLNNQDLKVAQARLEQALAKKRIAFSGMLPSIRFNPSFSRQEFSANRPNPFGGQLDQVTMSTYDVPLTLDYELDVFGKNINQVNAEKFALEASKENLKDMLLQITTEIARNYFYILQLDAEIALLKETENTRKNNLEIASTRYGAGLVSQIDVLRAETELSSVQVQLKRTQRLRAELELIIAPLVGVDASTFSISETTIKYLPPPLMILQKDAVVEHRPDLKSAKYAIESSKRLVKSQWKELLPAFYVNGSIGYLSGSDDNLIERNSRTWLAGVTASLPIFEGGKKRAEIKLRKSELKEAEATYEKQVQLSYQQTESSLSNIKWIHEQLMSQQDFVKAAQSAAQLTNERYRKGLVNYIDVVDAERQALDASQLSVQLFGQELRERISLIRAMGLFPYEDVSVSE